jgi:hypothetical protein
VSSPAPSMRSGRQTSPGQMLSSRQSGTSASGSPSERTAGSSGGVHGLVSPPASRSVTSSAAGSPVIAAGSNGPRQTPP